MALNVLLARLYVPRASNCWAGVAASAAGRPDANVLKTLNTLTPAGAKAVGSPYEYSGRNTGGRVTGIEPGVLVFVVTGVGVAVGMICGEAGSVVMSILSGPIRITPELKLALLKSMLIPLALNAENGVLVPGLVQYTRMLAGMQSKLPWPHDRGVGEVAVAPAVCTLNSSLTVDAVKSGGAEANGANRPSLHSGSPTVISGTVSEPVLMEKLAARGSVAALVPLPANV